MPSQRTLLLAAVILASIAPGPATGAAAADKPKKTEWTFSLLPNSLTKNPRLAMTVFTEFTPAGKELEPPTEQAPVFCVMFDAGRKKLGSASPGKEKAPPPDELMKQLRDALAANGYQVTDDPQAHTPSLAVLFHWGSYTSLTDEEEAAAAVAPGGEVDARMTTPADLPATGPTSPIVRHRELLERAALVGGEAFAHELAKVYTERVSIARAMPRSRADVSGGISGGMPEPVKSISGDYQSEFGTDLMDPLYIFENRDARTRGLMEQTRGSFYFIVASAFDYQSLAASKPILQWRTKMTVASHGVNMPQTLPVLVETCVPYLGREMDEAETITRRVRDGKVTLGEAEVVGYDDPPSQPDKATQPTPPGKK